MHKPQQALANELREAAEKVTVGELYYHYKTPTTAIRYSTWQLLNQMIVFALFIKPSVVMA